MDPGVHSACKRTRKSRSCANGLRTTNLLLTVCDQKLEVGTAWERGYLRAVFVELIQSCRIDTDSIYSSVPEPLPKSSVAFWLQIWIRLVPVLIQNVGFCCVVTLENDAEVMELRDLLSDELLSFCRDFDTDDEIFAAAFDVLHQSGPAPTDVFMRKQLIQPAPPPLLPAQH